MRVTENQLLRISERGLSKAKEKIGRAAEKLTSGVDVQRPSDDPTRWVAATRAVARRTLGASESKALQHGRAQLEEAGTRAQTIVESLSQAREQAVRFSNGTYGAEERAGAADAVRGLREQVRGALDARDAHGRPLFAGSFEGTPFDAAGNYLGDNVARTVPTVEGGALEVSLPGSAYTDGVNVLTALDDLETALRSNDQAGIRSALGGVEGAFDLANDALRTVGVRLQGLESAEDARAQLQLTLDERLNDLVGADPVQAARELAEGRSVLEGASALASQLASMLRVS